VEIKSDENPLTVLTVTKPKFQLVVRAVCSRTEIVLLRPQKPDHALPPAFQRNNDLSARQPGRPEIEVHDNGPGSAEALRTVFDPFALRTDSPLNYGINLCGLLHRASITVGGSKHKRTEGRGPLFGYLFR